MKVKKLTAIILTALLTLSLAACGGTSENDTSANTRPNDTAEAATPRGIDDPAEPRADDNTPATPSEDAEASGNETDSPGGNAGSDTPAEITIDAHDANLYNTKETAVPLNQWVYYQARNHNSGEYEPFYIRIVGVSRDSNEVREAIDNYTGIMDLSLTEDQARDIEYGILSFEIYFAPDYTAPEFGITVPSVSLSAIPTAESAFKTDGGMTYIGVGSSYNLGVNSSSERPHPSDTVLEKHIFSVLKNYDESEYVFRMTWYDGEIVAEKARELYFSLVK